MNFEQKAKLVFFLCLGVIVALLAYENHRLENEARNLRNEVRTSRLATENAIALSEITVLETDQWRRRAAQAELERDALAEELDERPVVETVVTVEVPAGVIEAPVDTVTRTVAFEDDWLAAEVEYRPVDVAAVLHYQIKPITLKVGVRCGAIDSFSQVRPAIVTVEQGQLPITIIIEEATIEPDVCNAPVVVQEDGGFDLKSAALGAAGVLGILLIGR